MNRLLKSIAILLLASTSHAWAGPSMNFHYADGTTITREVQVVRGEAAMNAAIRGGGPSVTLDTDVRLRDEVTFEEIFVVVPGQSVLAGAFFNQLSTLEVPFTALVGRPIIMGVFAPDVGLSSIVQFPIEADDENLVGISVLHTIPAGASQGAFFILGINQIAGLTPINNVDSGARVVQVPPGR